MHEYTFRRIRARNARNRYFIVVHWVPRSAMSDDENFPDGRRASATEDAPKKKRQK